MADVYEPNFDGDSYTGTELPEGIAAKPNDFESKPYEHDPLTNTWVSIDKWL